MSTSAVPVHVALVDDSKTLRTDQLALLAGALNEQVQADFAPAWHVKATVGIYRRVPKLTWRIHLQDGLDEPGAAGYHSDDHNQPYARVDLTAGDWTVTVSHELLEILADPFGNRMHSALGPVGTQHEQLRVHYLLEVCDPCEARSYPVSGVALSDFLLPPYYRSSISHRPVSYAGGVTSPREVAPGGYVSYALDSGEWWQATNFGGLETHSIGTFKGGSSLREWTDAEQRERRA